MRIGRVHWMHQTAQKRLRLPEGEGSVLSLMERGGGLSKSRSPKNNCGGADLAGTFCARRVAILMNRGKANLRCAWQMDCRFQEIGRSDQGLCFSACYTGRHWSDALGLQSSTWLRHLSDSSICRTDSTSGSFGVKSSFSQKLRNRSRP